MRLRDAELVWVDWTVQDERAHRRLLSIAELARADSFRFEPDRRRFTVVRGSLRRELGLRLDQAPGDVSFTYGPQGKPFAAGDRRWHFSVSHGGEVSAIAFAEGQNIGLDLLASSRSEDLLGLADHFLSGIEQERLAQLPIHELPGALRRTWTAKEAVLKSLGTGLSLDPRWIQTDLAPEGVTRVGDATVEWTPMPARRGGTATLARVLDS